MNRNLPGDLLEYIAERGRHLFGQRHMRGARTGVNWLRTVSANGISQAAGFMANGLYDLNKIERNHEMFENKSKAITWYFVRKALCKYEGRRAS